MRLTNKPLTPEQKQAWESTMSLMAWQAPGFRHLLYRLLQHHDGQHTAVMAEFEQPGGAPGIACTDGQNVIVNPDEFFKFSLKERVFIMAHEVIHNVYGDVETLHQMHNQTHITTSDGKTFPYDEEIMQKVMDYRINALAVESRIGAMPKEALYDPKISSGKDGILDIYGKVYEQHQKNPPSGGGPGQGNSQGKNGFDNLAPPGASTGQSPGQAQQKRNPQQWAVEVAAAQHLEASRSQGHMAGAMKHLFDSILDPKVPWYEHIAVSAKRIMGSGSYTWRKPDRRFIGRDLWLPGRGGEGSDWLVIWGDTSGSITDAELNRYLGEMRGMIEDVKPRRLTAIWCDAEVHHVDDITDLADLENVKARGVGGRGGTAIEPVWDWIAEQRGAEPQLFIGMTDGCFTFPDPPTYPVLWASVHDDKTRYPYGEVVPINS